MRIIIIVVVNVINDFKGDEHCMGRFLTQLVTSCNSMLMIFKATFCCASMLYFFKIVNATCCRKKMLH